MNGKGEIDISRLFIITCFCFVLMTHVQCSAGVKEDYEQAYKVYIAAGACMAAYSDRYGQLVNKYLERDGWQIERFEKAGDSVDARFLLARKQAEDGSQMYVLALVGTENGKDMKANFEVEKVYFAGSNVEEFAINAAKIGVPSTEPKVHRGFNEFVQAGLLVKGQDTDGQVKYLSEMLLINKERKIYLVGHSRGGAAATLTGARLISMGVRPEQIEIISFGAPAVGNEAFANRFAPIMNVTRVVISGDPVTGVLQTIVGGYRQFGREIIWEAPITADNPHSMTGYADVAMKKYYDMREKAVQAGLIQLPTCTVGTGGSMGKVYIAPLINHLPTDLAKEFPYIKQVLFDEYRQLLPGYSFDDDSAFDQSREKALKKGCKWLIVPEVSGHRLKEKQNVYYISLSQVIYDVNTGAIIKAADFSTGTYNLTPLEAFIHVTKDMSYDWLIKR